MDIHSDIKFVSPSQFHNDEGKSILKMRELVYQQAKKEKRNRCCCDTRNWKTIDDVYLNPGKPKIIARQAKAV